MEPPKQEVLPSTQLLTSFENVLFSLSLPFLIPLILSTLPPFLSIPFALTHSLSLPSSLSLSPAFPFVCLSISLFLSVLFVSHSTSLLCLPCFLSFSVSYALSPSFPLFSFLPFSPLPLGLVANG